MPALPTGVAVLEWRKHRELQESDSPVASGARPGHRESRGHAQTHSHAPRRVSRPGAQGLELRGHGEYAGLGSVRRHDLHG